MTARFSIGNTRACHILIYSDEGNWTYAFSWFLWNILVNFLIVMNSDWALWPVQIHNLTSETYESIFGHLVGLPGRGISRRKASTYTGQHKIEKRGHISMPWAGFETMIPVLALLKTVRGLDCAATETGLVSFLSTWLSYRCHHYTGCGRETDDYKNNSNTVIKNYKNIPITFWTRHLEGDLHPCANTPLISTLAVPGKNILKIASFCAASCTFKYRFSWHSTKSSHTFLFLYLLTFYHQRDWEKWEMNTTFWLVNLKGG
jgi:hypothetical protein